MLVAIYWRYFLAMRKKIVVILFILSNAFFAACLIDVAVTSILASPVISSCSPNCTSQDLLGVPTILIGAIVLGTCYVVSLLLGITVSLSALIKQAKQQQWTWFVCTLLFGFLPIFGDIYLLIYLIAVPEISQQHPPLLPQK